MGRQLGQAAFTVSLIVIILWVETPPWQRQMILRQIRVHCRKLADRAARVSGHHAMGRELHGTPEDEAGYELPLWLSTLRDRL